MPLGYGYPVISHLADASIYLTRSNFTEKELLGYVDKLIKEKDSKMLGLFLMDLALRVVTGIAMVINMGIIMDMDMDTEVIKNEFQFNVLKFTLKRVC